MSKIYAKLLKIEPYIFWRTYLGVIGAGMFVTAVILLIKG